MTAQEAIILTKMALAEPEPDYDEDDYDDDLEPDYDDLAPDHRHAGLDAAVGRMAPLRETFRPYIDLASSKYTHNLLFPRLVPPIVPPDHENREDCMHNHIQGHVLQEESDYQNYLRKRLPSSNHHQANNWVRPYRPFHRGSCHHVQMGDLHRRRDSRFVRNNELERQFSKRMSPLNYI